MARSVMPVWSMAVLRWCSVRRSSSSWFAHQMKDAILSDDFFFGDFGDSADAVRGGGLHGDGVDEVLVAGDDAGALGSLDAFAAAVADDVGADVDEAVEVFARREAVRGVDDDACAVGVCDVDDVFECDVFGGSVSDPVDHLGVGIVDECLVVLLGGDDFRAPRPSAGQVRRFLRT